MDIVVVVAQIVGLCGLSFMLGRCYEEWRKPELSWGLDRFPDNCESTTSYRGRKRMHRP